jgi:hypothetical protein
MQLFASPHIAVPDTSGEVREFARLRKFVRRSASNRPRSASNVDAGAIGQRSLVVVILPTGLQFYRAALLLFDERWIVGLFVDSRAAGGQPTSNGDQSIPKRARRAR